MKQRLTNIQAQLSLLDTSVLNMLEDSESKLKQSALKLFQKFGGLLCYSTGQMLVVRLGLGEWVDAKVTTYSDSVHRFIVPSCELTLALDLWNHAPCELEHNNREALEGRWFKMMKAKHSQQS